MRREIYIDFTYSDTLGRHYSAHQVAGANPGDDVSTGGLVIEQVQSLKSMTFREKVLHLFVYATSKALWRVGGFMKANGITSFSQLLIKTAGFVYLYRQAKVEEAARIADLPNNDAD